MDGMLADLGPWLAVVGLGLLHGLSPAGGWLFAAGWGLRAGSVAQVPRALLTLALGHAAALVLVAWSLAAGLALDRGLAQRVAGVVLLMLALVRLRHARRGALPGGCGSHAGLALWSGLMAMAHGTGLMLVPALAPLCVSDGPARALTASGSVALAAAAAAAHLASMLLAAGAMACAVCRGAARYPALAAGPLAQHAGTAMLATTGALLLART